MEVFVFYSQSVSYISPKEASALHPGAVFQWQQTEQEEYCALSWHDLSITLSLMPAPFIPAHLAQLSAEILGCVMPRGVQRSNALLARLNNTQSVTSVQVEPGLDAEGRARLVLARLAVGLGALVLTSGALFNTKFQLLLAPDGSYDPKAEF